MCSVSVKLLDCPYHHYVRVFSGNTFIYATNMSAVVRSLDLSLWQEGKLSNSSVVCLMSRCLSSIDTYRAKFFIQC